jgi:porin
MTNNKTIRAIHIALAAAAMPLSSDCAGTTNEPPKTLWNRDTLLGDLCGVRPRLAEHGISFVPVYTGEVMGETGGAYDGNRAVYAHNLNLPLDVDLEKLAGWRGALFHVNAFWIAGRGLTEDTIGDLANVSNINAYRTFRLNELWLEQSFGENLSVKAGNIAVDTEFFSSAASALLINSSFGTFSLIAANLPNSPIYPVAAPAVRVALHAGKHWTFQAAVFDGDCLAQDVNKNGTDFHLAAGDGALIFSEVQFTPHPDADDKTLASVFKLGGFLHTKRTQTWAAQFNGETGGGSVNYGIYGVAEQDLYKRDGKSITAFVRGGGAPGNRSVIGWYVDVGVNFKGFVPGRDNDVAGIAFARSTFSRSFSDYTQATDGTDEINSEMVIEATYRAQLTPWWMLQPDLQIILTPGGEKSAAHAVVLGLRTAISF